MTDLAKFTVDGLVFSHVENSDEPRIRDIDAAVRAGWKRPRDIRKLIQRLRKAGLLPGIYVRATVARSQTPTGGVRSYTVEEFWLTEAELLLVMARSNSEFGLALINELVRVFILARKGIASAPLPETFERFMLSRSHVRNNPDVRATVRNAIRGAATARRESFAKCHGALRKRFEIPGYQSLTLIEVLPAVEWLQSMVKDTPVGQLARQLSLWPTGEA